MTTVFQSIFCHISAPSLSLNTCNLVEGLVITYCLGRGLEDFGCCKINFTWPPPTKLYWCSNDPHSLAVIIFMISPSHGCWRYVQIPILKNLCWWCKFKAYHFWKGLLPLLFQFYFEALIWCYSEKLSLMFFFYLHSQGFVTLDSCEAAEKAVDEVCRGEKSTLLSLVTLTHSIPRSHK